jgi:hypothetical protein
MDTTTIVLLSVAGTSALWACGALFAANRVAAHCRGNGLATAALVDHVILPIIGREAKKPTVPVTEPATDKPLR